MHLYDSQHRMARMFSVATVTVLAVALVVSNLNCKPKEPPPPETPEMAPLAEKPTSASRNASGSLPPGHPPIDGSVQTPPPSKSQNGLPPGHPPIGGQQQEQPTAEAGDVEAPTEFDGIELTPPEGWTALPRKSTGGAFAVVPEAAFQLPAGDDASADVSVRLTHFPKMKRVPLEMHLNRWYGQFRQPDGTPTKEVAMTQSFVVDDITVTLADISGTLVQGNVPNFRMLAAAIEHDKGPHFLTAKGPAPAVAKWRDSIVSYLKSVKPRP